MSSAARPRLEKPDRVAGAVARRTTRNQTHHMHGTAVQRDDVATTASAESALSALIAYDCDRDGPAVSIPRPEVHLVARFGPSARNGLDIHAFGVRQRVHRKTIRRGQRTVTARLQLSAPRAVLGLPASAIAGRIVALEDLWGDAAVRRLHARLGDARDTPAAAAILESAIAERFRGADHHEGGMQLALAAADRLASASVTAVAEGLGVSERHLRRVFREFVGVGPKAFAKLARFQRALRAAREDPHAGWAAIAATAGYYDQAHLIGDFRAIADVTPRALLEELRTGRSIG
jgi:AraC-like DNA-binding protein